MNALDCLVHPQVGTEAFGAVLLEAFACGKPVIASALDGITEAFAAGQQGRLVQPEKVKELAAALAIQAKVSPLEHGAATGLVWSGGESVFVGGVIEKGPRLLYGPGSEARLTFGEGLGS